ncbi:hypothetical protein FW778_12685 [Ginsengibacter hankyongi]|uniref:histidine kinase n=1 Tax=Ginsengibacter hankyongi TaxID=2607284 RepID=A0A5J5IH74_9BACT|nr:ATP-binding protein [Ginsengibacter hankyongi]KAA9038420.1 hypothetical protein FW778_12685 [Ginsengibacter hankyongi]
MKPPEMLYQERINQVETELVHARSLINYYKKAHEDFIMIASHDLQAPLRKLSTFVERLVYKFQEVKGDEVNNYVERIQSTLAGMRKMIDGLSVLTYTSEASPGFAKCSLDEILQQVLTDFASLFAEANTTIECTALPVIDGNAVELKSLFENIILNAVKFQHKDVGSKIQITTMPVSDAERNKFSFDAASSYHKIVVTDNGVGFDDQYSDKIFDPFIRLHGKSDFEGNGFGLALCKKIIEKHHGFIYAKSNKNSGSSFILFFPETHN